MSRERLYLFDTTLRDGAQTNGVDFTLHDKQIIAQMLDDLGIDYVEGGYPGANPTGAFWMVAISVNCPASFLPNASSSSAA
jgi:2-isopropylmalate synthase